MIAIRDLFLYNFDFGSMEPDSSRVAQCVVQQDAHFELLRISGCACYRNTRRLTVPDIDLQFVDLGSCRMLADALTPLAALRGMILDPRMFRGATVIELRGQTGPHFAYDRLRVVLIGRKVFWLS